MKPPLIFTLILLFCCANFAQTPALTSEQTNAIQEIGRLNEQLIKFYKEKDFDEALNIGKKMRDLVAANNLSGDANILISLGNLAEIYLLKGKESEAIALFQPISDAYEKMGDKGKAGFEKSLSRLAYAYTKKKDYKNAETEYLKLKNLTEAAYGEKSRQAANIYLQLANLYSLQNRVADTDNYFLKAILLNDELLSEKEKETREDVDTYTCSLYHRAFQQNGIKEPINFTDDLDKKRGISPDKNLDLGIVNGKAKNLVIPQYPQSARSKRVSGFAIVRVNIDERGKVTKAKARCGFLDFVNEVENAAMKSTFAPTLENGLPVKVTGDIVYKFIAQ